MGRLLEFILFAVVAYFVFKFLNQLFSSSPNTNNNTNASTNTNNNRSQKHNSSSSIKKNINWDAETIDYEEIERKDDEKK